MANVHVIIGEDDCRVAETARQVIGDGVGLEVVDSLNATNAELQLKDLRAAEASFSTPPFLDPKKVTWWKNVGFLPGGGKRDSSEEVKEALEGFAAKLVAEPLPANQHFILSGPHLLKTSVFAKTLATAAEIVVFAAEKPWERHPNAVVRVIDLAKEAGLSFAPGAADRFVDIVGFDLRSEKSELEKLACYLGKGESVITSAILEAVASPGVMDEPMLWEVTDYVGARDLEKALRAMKKFDGDAGFAVMMTTAIEKLFRQLVEVAEKRTQDLAPYQLRKLQGFLRNWTLAELRSARARFVHLREQVVSGVRSGDLLVVTTLARVCRRRARR